MIPLNIYRKENIKNSYCKERNNSMHGSKFEL